MIDLLKHRLWAARIPITRSLRDDAIAYGAYCATAGHPWKQCEQMLRITTDRRLGLWTEMVSAGRDYHYDLPTDTIWFIVKWRENGERKAPAGNSGSEGC